MQQPWQTPRAAALNEALRRFCETHGLRWDPGQRDGLWVEEHDGRLYLADASHAATWGEPLTDDEATPDELERIAEVWLHAVQGREEGAR